MLLEVCCSMVPPVTELYRPCEGFAREVWHRENSPESQLAAYPRENLPWGSLTCWVWSPSQPLVEWVEAALKNRHQHLAGLVEAWQVEATALWERELYP
jgi:hypothetical protein